MPFVNSQVVFPLLLVSLLTYHVVYFAGQRKAFPSIVYISDSVFRPVDHRVIIRRRAERVESNGYFHSVSENAQQVGEVLFSPMNLSYQGNLLSVWMLNEPKLMPAKKKLATAEPFTAPPPPTPTAP